MQIHTHWYELQDLQLVFYGDDWVESWRGTAAGDPCPACDGIRAMWERHFATQWSAAVYGIAGASHTLVPSS